MRKFIATLIVPALLTIGACAPSYTVDLTDTGARVAGFDTEYVDKLVIHCRTPMDLVVDIEGNALNCASGEKVSFRHEFPIAYSSRSSSTASTPVVIYPKSSEHSDIQGVTGSWRVSRNSDSDESWLVELNRGYLRINRAR